MDEHRKTIRASTRLYGRAVLDGASPAAVACFVQDFSPTGACVVFARAVAIPKYFDLFVGQDSQGHRARTIWRQANTAGVMFLEARANAPEVLPA
jgi:hypothetical protein